MILPLTFVKNEMHTLVYSSQKNLLNALLPYFGAIMSIDNVVRKKLNWSIDF